MTLNHLQVKEEDDITCDRVLQLRLKRKRRKKRSKQVCYAYSFSSLS